MFLATYRNGQKHSVGMVEIFVVSGKMGAWEKLFAAKDKNDCK
jgi:hypothetical protein